METPFWLFELFVIALSVLLTSVFNAGGCAVGLSILFHYASNAAFVFGPLLPENKGGELAMFSSFVALSLTAAGAVLVAKGPASLANRARTISRPGSDALARPPAIGPVVARVFRPC